jgi:acyl transferase domain-containing protein/thioesterase domain-containing protein/SAM-dependent methyltransferase
MVDDPTPAEGIAIIGMAGRFPGAADVDAFWNNLSAGVESVTFFSEAELLAAGVSPGAIADPRYVRARARVDGADRFDPAFFGMSPREAEGTDPQHRIFLEHCWEAFERAGHDPARVRGAVGVFAGAGADGYLVHHLVPERATLAALGPLGALVGNDKDHLALRVSYKLDLRGPSLTVQTACSTSLVAVQLACQALLGYQCDMALAGGVSLAFPRDHGYLFQEGLILSPDGHCRPFDAAARGTVIGEGAGVVLLRRLEDALADGDPIHAVIRGAAVNNDGAAKVGYTAPGVEGQAEVIAAAHALAGVSARSIGYVEAHGTGTALGDPIEVSALARAFRAGGARAGGVLLGSVKGNIGHLNTASGVASLIKTAFALEHRELPASLNFSRPNPELDLASTPFAVCASARPFPAGPDGGPRRAGVSSFGFGGTNVHAVLEEPPPEPLASPSPRLWHLLTLSARSDEARDAMSRRLADHLEAHPELDLADVAHTLHVGRRAFARRRAVVARDRAEAIAALRGEAERVIDGAVTSDGSAPEVAFLFPGQGAQRAGMGAEIARAEPVFREALDRAAEIARPLLGLDLREVISSGEGLDDTALTQPALFAVEHALARLWMSWGVIPGALLGHSLGEFTAACLAGVMSLEDTLALLVARGRRMAATGPGAMLALPLGEAELAPLLGASLSIAAVNGPRATVVSGPEPAVAALAEQLEAHGIRGRPLRATRAFHSALMDPAAAAFATDAARARLVAPSIPYLSNRTGAFITPAEATDPRAWGRHLREPVRFADGLAELARAPRRVLLEVGPGRALTALSAQQRGGVRAVPSLEGGAGGELSALYAALGALWCEGAPVDWDAFHEGERRRRVRLPTYPFERRRCWVDAPAPSLPAEDGLAVEARRLRAMEASLGASAPAPIADDPVLAADLAALASALVGRFLRDAGVDPEGSPVALRAALGVAPRFHRMLDFLLALRAPGVEAIEALSARIVARRPDLGGLVRLLDHCAAHYQGALSGRVEAISVLYPGGSTELMDACERRSGFRGEQLYLRLLCDAVRAFARARPGRAVRVLEVGGGQGTLTWPLVEALRGEDVAYHFTDVTRAFLADARAEAERRGLAGRMSFGLFDISRPPAAQGLAAESFDVIVAFNVVHATADLAASLRHLGAVLAPGGRLALCELLRADPWDTMIWGLADGWWSFDDGLRRASPIVDLPTWEGLLRALGFDRVDGFPEGASARARAQHGLVIGSLAPGRVVVPAPAEAAADVGPGTARSTEHVAPRDDDERRIAAICEELLGVRGIGVHDDFFALGADSLVTLRIADRVARDLGRELPASASFRGATVAKMAVALGRRAAPEAGSPLVCIQAGGARPPLFFVHPAAGVIFPYVELARALGPDQPFYGLQARGLDGEAPPDATIEDMARRYVAALRSAQPAGPYHVGGFSFGCLVAFEMAQQLRRDGQEVALLALVDEPAPIDGFRPSRAVMAKLVFTSVARTIWPHLHDYLYLGGASRDRSGAPSQRLPKLDQILRFRPDFALIERFVAGAALADFVPMESREMVARQPAVVPMFRLFLVHLRETLAYAPAAYPHAVTLYKATKLEGRAGQDPTMGWGALAAGGVRVRPMPGEHLTMIRRPHVAALAAAMRADLDEAMGLG